MLRVELIDSNGQIIAHDKSRTDWYAVDPHKPAPFSVDKRILKLGTYQLKISYNGNIKDGIPPAVKYVKVNVIK